MSVSIEEVMAESGEEAAPAPPAPAPKTAGRQEPDLDRLEYQMARRHHRLARLWAD
jgi:ribosomal protein L12E/L44/L45/RPP1/RPP2